MKQTSSNILSRRKALAGGATVGAAAAAAALMPLGSDAPRQAEAAPAGTTDAAGGEGYRVTEHIRRYYATART